MEYLIIMESTSYESLVCLLLRPLFKYITLMLGSRGWRVALNFWYFHTSATMMCHHFCVMLRIPNCTFWTNLHFAQHPSHFFQILLVQPKAWMDITNQISIYLLQRFPKSWVALARSRLRNTFTPLLKVLILWKWNGDGGLETMKKDYFAAERERRRDGQAD